MSNSVTKLTNDEVKFLEKLRNNRNEEGDRSFLSLLFSATIPDQDTALKRLNSLFGHKYKDIFREIGTDGGKASFSDLKRLQKQKKAYGNGKDLEISSMRLQTMLRGNGIPLCHELFVSKRVAFGYGSLK